MVNNGPFRWLFIAIFIGMLSLSAYFRSSSLSERNVCGHRPAEW